MDSSVLSYSLELVAGSGNTLSVEQRAALQTSVVLLKKNYKFHRVLFWGKILGITKDYFIAQGRGEDEMQDKKNLYSFNCMDWFLLPLATDSMIEEVTKAAKSRFIGDPSAMENEPCNSSSESDCSWFQTTVNEESRLAVTIHQIDEEASVVPRGALVKNPHGLVQINRSFGGLSHSEARRLDNFLHFSKAKNPKKSVLEVGVVNQTIDFLDVLMDDIPKGSWSLQLECASNVCVLRSLLWLGLTFFHVPMTPQHGYMYIGDGKKNLDLPFML
ncbi:radial spoke head protein 9 homolog isoform X2 [Anarrhichthys ocellatus]|uniref:radial spoke head protein 9 homolog isoform X2 n=1 Tax=Anarrhichthys ocellatus TaxID=433405 RepID=UPI0012ED1441|nr:radial spoke head protein 9 homolog isoform X2 [Anarrhichthys ocellatus]